MVREEFGILHRLLAKQMSFSHLELISSLAHRYNDHHFHYGRLQGFLSALALSLVLLIIKSCTLFLLIGYHVYAAAIVAKHRPEWGREYYDRILLYIRDIANPSSEDKDFPMFRQKGEIFFVI